MCVPILFVSQLAVSVCAADYSADGMPVAADITGIFLQRVVVVIVIVVVVLVVYCRYSSSSSPPLRRLLVVFIVDGQDTVGYLQYSLFWPSTGTTGPLLLFPLPFSSTIDGCAASAAAVAGD